MKRIFLFAAIFPIVLSACATKGEPPAVHNAVGQVHVDVVGSEASGIVYDPQSDAYVIVTDRGDVIAVNSQGEILRSAAHAGANFEGITRDPLTGFLYAVIEGKDSIVEIHPQSFAWMREFSINRKLEGEKVIQGGKEGFEGVEFVPDAHHHEGGTFYVVNQVTANATKPEPSALLEIEVPLRSALEVPEGKKAIKSKIIRVIPTSYVDLAGMEYVPVSGHLFVLSDTQNLLLEMTQDGHVLAEFPVPGENQEGFAFGPAGQPVIVEDLSGSVSLRFFELP